MKMEGRVFCVGWGVEEKEKKELGEEKKKTRMEKEKEKDGEAEQKNQREEACKK